MCAVFAAGLLLGSGLPAIGNPAASKVTNVLTDRLAPELAADSEVLIDLVEIPPNARLDWHWHPGEEFHYYLAGDAVIEREGLPPIAGTPGTAGHVAFKTHHQARAGAQGAKILVFRVHAKGQPWRYLDDEHAHGAG
jgi:quercetin dioxygenase-like cupin family protein